VARPAAPIEHQIRAFELISEGKSLAAAQQVLRNEGIEAGLETIRRWAKTGAKAAALIQENAADAEDNTTPEFVRQKFTHFLNKLLDRGFQELDQGAGEYKDIAPIMLRIASEEARVLGGYAALRIAHELAAGAGNVDPATQRMVEEMQRRAAERDQEIRNPGGTES